jgi:hypothetical protein
LRTRVFRLSATVKKPVVGLALFLFLSPLLVPLIAVVALVWIAAQAGFVSEASA